MTVLLRFGFSMPSTPSSSGGGEWTGCVSGVSEEDGWSSGDGIEDEEARLVNFGFDLPGYLDSRVEEMEAWWNRVPVDEMLLAIDRDEERMNMQESGREKNDVGRRSEPRSGTAERRVSRGKK
jgi:hypothetical protein